MSNSVFRFIVKSLGVCCPAEYIRLTRKEPSKSLSAFLGVHVRTIRYWRFRVQHKKVGCEHCPNCPRRPDALPIVLPPQRKTLFRPKDSAHCDLAGQTLSVVILDDVGDKTDSSATSAEPFEDHEPDH